MDETTAPISGMIIDMLILGCLVVAIVMGALLLWQIMTLRRERFRFDQMTQSLSGQLAILQSALSNGKEDLETKIKRFDRLLDQARTVADELHVLVEAAGNVRQQTVSDARRGTQKGPERMASDRMERVAEEAPPERARPMFAIVDPEFAANVKEDSHPAVDDYADLTPGDRAELAQLATPAEKALMAALKRAGRR